MAGENDGFGEGGGDDIGGFRVEFQEDGEGVAFDVGFQAAEVSSEEHGEHVYTLVDKVDGCASHGGFEVHRIVGLDEVGNIGDVHTDFNVAVRKGAGMESIVDVLAARWINAADKELAKISASFPARVFKTGMD